MTPPITSVATKTLTLLLLGSCSYPIAASTLDLKTQSFHPTVAQKQEVFHQLKVAQSPVLKDTLVIPGERVGPVARNTTRQDLVKLFGESRLFDKTIPGLEGEGKFSATQVNLGSDRTFMVVWSDTTRTKPLDVRNLGTAWKTPQGIGMGTTFSQLRKQLGEFQLYGLAWDYSGTVLLKDTRLSPYLGKLILQVQAAPNAATKFPNDYRAVSGDRTLSSTNPHWKPLGMRVGQMIVVLNPD